MIFEKDAETIQWGNDSFFKKTVLGKLTTHMQKNEVGEYIKMNSNGLKPKYNKNLQLTIK